MIDEPLNGLDNKTRQWFKEFLIDFIKANKTILISTHEQELLSLPHSRIIKFNDEHTIFKIKNSTKKSVVYSLDHIQHFYYL